MHAIRSILPLAVFPFLAVSPVPAQIKPDASMIFFISSGKDGFGNPVPRGFYLIKAAYR